MRRWIQLEGLLQTYRQRALALLVVSVVAFLLLGRAMILPGVPDDEWGTLEKWSRDAVFAVVRPGNTTPVTYVDINNALYRDIWGMPVITPRGELRRMLQTLEVSAATLVVVDIDLAWGDYHDALGEFIRSYAGPPLVFVRHLEETAAGIVDAATPYDADAAGNAAVQWAHAYFYSDADGALREWLPWLALCVDDMARYLPSAAMILAGDAAPAAGTDCVSPDALASLPIIYTEDYGFAGLEPAADDGAAVWMQDPFGPARRVDARAMLDETPIDTGALFDARVVIIGGSHTAGQDLRLTPVGVLPGAVVQANTLIHSRAQLATVESSEFALRLVSTLLFLVLALLAFWFGAILVILYAVVVAGTFSYYGVFEQVEVAALLFVQFRLLAWLAEPFWSGGLRILLPDFLQKEPESDNEAS